MTMPHLMNCLHQDYGWCLKCVRELWEEKELAQNQLSALQIDFSKLRDAVKRTVNLDDCGHAGGTSLILVDAIKSADETLICDDAHHAMMNGQRISQSFTPEHIKEWLSINKDVPAKNLKCPFCGNWFASIDHLAPYYWDTCWCEKCQSFPLQENQDDL